MLHDFRKSLVWNLIASLVPNKITSSAVKLTVEGAAKSLDKDEEVIDYGENNKN